MELVSLDILKELAKHPSQIKEDEGYSFKDIKEHYIEYRNQVLKDVKDDKFGHTLYERIDDKMIGYLKGNADIRYVGQGSSRTSYAMNGGDCLKIAFNKKGIAQNYQEVKNTLNNKYDCFPRLKDYDRRYYGVILTECCSIINDQRLFDDMINDKFDLCGIGVLINVLKFIRSYEFDIDEILKPNRKKKIIKELRQDNFQKYAFMERLRDSQLIQYKILRDLIRFFIDNGRSDAEMCIEDLNLYENWGMAIRGGNIVPIVIDAGFSDKVFSKHYEKSEDRLDESGEAYFIDDQDICESVITEDRLSRELDLLKSKFKKGTVTFQYKKKSTGEKRVAHGTLNFKKMKKDGFVIRQIPNYISQRYKDYPNLFVYYDMDKHNWRCFDINNFTGLYR